MIFHVNHLLADDSQTVLSLIFQKDEKKICHLLRQSEYSPHPSPSIYQTQHLGLSDTLSMVALIKSHQTCCLTQIIQIAPDHTSST